MEGKFDSLRQKLGEENWPKVYLFKFILPKGEKKVDVVRALFDENTKVETRPSSKGKYISISIKKKMESAAAVIDIYNKADKIEGIIIL